MNSKEVKRIVAVITARIDRPVIDKQQVAHEVLLYGYELTFIEKVEVMKEVCKKFGV
jgi:hypothetical protein